MRYVNWPRAAGLCVATVTLAVACSSGTQEVTTRPSEAGPDESAGLQAEPTGSGVVLDALIEPEKALVADFGDGWVKTDEWFVEADVSYSSDCEEFNVLIDIGNSGGPTALWRSDGGELVQRVADLNWGVDDYMTAVRDLPGACPTLTVGDITMQVSALELGVAGSEGYTLSAYPIPDPTSSGEMPEFDRDRVAWVVVVSRHNVVSRLTLSSTPGSDPPGLEGLVDLAKISLETAPIEATGSFPQPGRQPEATGTVTGAVVTFDTEDCRNEGSVEAAGIIWALADPVPFTWRDAGEATGTLMMQGGTATFTADDGTILMLATETEGECFGWDDDEPAPSSAPPQVWDRLSCTPGFVVEARVPDTGETPESIARAASPNAVTIEPGQPLQWWGYDAEDQVVVGVLLGDAPDTGYQILTCSDRG